MLLPESSMFSWFSRIYVSMLCLGAIVLLGKTSQAQTIHFADTNLESAVRDAISKPTGPITPADIQSLTYLYAWNRSIRDLSGLEYATNLTDLYLDENEIQSAAPLERMPQLRSLSVFGNQLGDISFLRHLPNLQSLDIGGNVIWNFSPLPGLTNLNSLNIEYSGLIDVSFVAKMKWLRSLSVYNNQIEDVSPLSTLTNATDFDLFDNPITNLTVLGSLTSLSQMAVGDATMTSLEWVKAFPSLPSLSLFDSSVSNFTPLLGLTNLVSFSLENNTAADLGPLAQLTSLRDLDLTGPHVTNLPFTAEVPQLRSLTVSYCGVADITPITNLTHLGSFHGWYDRISNIDCLLGMTNLFQVDVFGNLLNTNTGSAPMNVISNLQGKGVLVNYLPQKSRPTWPIRTNWNIPNTHPSFMRVSASADTAYEAVPAITLADPDPGLISSSSIVPLGLGYYGYRLNVVPASNQTGSTVLHLIATDGSGLRSTQDVQLTLSTPLPFPAQVLNSSNLVWTTGGAAPWFTQTTNTHDGVSAAQSGSPDSWLETKVTGPGAISFWHATAPRQDLFNGGLVSISRADGSFPGVIQLSAGPCWQQTCIPIPAGTWVLRWDPLASDFWSAPPNRLWLDQVAFTSGSAGSVLEIDSSVSFAGRYVHLYGEPGATMVLEQSSDLHTWSPFSTLQFTEFDGWVADPTWRLPQRFYRLRKTSP
jgi:Leucine-rich repeat (LRR) protein